MDEGKLSRFRSKIVCESSLADAARQLNLGEFLKLGHGETTTGGRNKSSILSDALEAVFGAIFLDSNFDIAKKIIISVLKDSMNVFSEEDIIDPKSHLQEILQENSTNPVIYKIISESGPAHKRSYVAQVSHDGRILGEGSGKNKKEAEQHAASQAINKLKEKK
jgi:ribonuclease-3